MLQPNPRGHYRFLPGIEPFSSGVIADPGYEIVHVTLERPVPYREGFARIESRLWEAGRTVSALCGVELRSPAPFTREGFIRFNEGYCELLGERGLILESGNPIARTNVVPRHSPPAETLLFGFSFTIPARPGTRPTFVVAGGGDLRGGTLLEAPIVRAGESGPEAMREKAAYVMRVMTRRLEGLGVSWEAVTATEVYTIRPLDDVLEPVVLAGMGGAARAGLHWFPAQPPIEGLEFEMDLRGVRLEELLTG